MMKKIVLLALMSGPYVHAAHNEQDTQKDLFAENKSTVPSVVPTQQQATGALQLLLASGCAHSSLRVAVRTLDFSLRGAPALFTLGVIAAGSAVTVATGICGIHVARWGLRNIQADDASSK